MHSTSNLGANTLSFIIYIHLLKETMYHINQWFAQPMLESYTPTRPIKLCQSLMAISEHAVMIYQHIKYEVIGVPLNVYPMKALGWT